MFDFSKPKTVVLFSFLLLILAILRISFDSDLNNFGINKTVGSTWVTVATSVLIILFSLLVYTVLWIYKFKVNKTFSLFNLSFLTGILGLIGLNFSVIFGLNAVLMLLMNITHAIAAKKNEKKKNLQ